MFEYEFDGNRFTQKDVDDRAAEKGLTTEEYLKQNVDIKKISIEQPTPVIDTSQDPVGWITPGFFDDTEEQAKGELEQRLPDGFEIIESGFFLGDDQKRYGLTNALEIKHKDSDESIKLEFNIAGAAKPDDEETMTAYYNKQVEELKQFINANLKTEEKTQLQTEREKRRVATEAYLKEVTATEEEVQSIIEDFSDVSVFDVREEVLRTREAGMDIKFKAAGPDIIKKIQPYKELLQQTRTKLESEQEGVVTEDQVKQAALKELRLQEVQKLEKKKTEDFLNTLDDGEMPKLTKEYWEDIETLPVPEKLKDYFTVGAKEYAEDLASTYEFQLKNKQQLNQIEQQLADFEKIEEVTEQDVLDYLDVYDTYLKKVDEFNSTVEILNTYSGETVEKVEDQLNLLKKNYSLLDKTAVGLALSFRDYGAKALYGLGTQIDPASELEQTFKIAKVLEKSNRIRARYADDVQFEDAFSSVKSFGKYALQLSVDQAPILASLAIPGGWSALLANSFGENYKNMTLEDFEAAVAAEAFGEEFEARSKSNKALTSLFYAAPEVVLDRLTTGLRIRGIKEMFENSTTRPLMEVATKEAFGKLAFGTPMDAAIGGVTEGSTQIWQNWITGKENLLEGVAEATFAGVIMDGALSSIPNVKALVMSRFSDFNTYKPVREINEQINSLKTTVQAVDPNTDYAKYLNKQIKDLEVEQSEKIREIESNIIGTNGKLGLRASDVDAYVKFTAEQENLRLQAESIINNKGLTNSKKKQLLAPLKVQFDIYSDAINKVKTGGQSNWSIYSSDFKNTKDVDTRKEAAKEKLIADGITNPTDIQVDDATRVQFNLEAIEKDIANAKEGELDKTLLVIKSRQDVEKIEDEAVKQLALKAYDNGDFGFNLPQDIDGKSSLVFTENMAKDDRTQVRTHELFHEFGKQAFDNNNSIFNGMAQTIVNWAKINDKALYETLQRRVKRKNGKLINDEVIAVFMEEVADNRVRLKSERNRSLLAILGFGVNKAMKDGYDLNVDLAGVDDTFNLIYGIAKKISKGALTKAEIDVLAETKAIKQLKKEGQRIAEQYLFETQGEAARHAKNTQQKIDDLGNKYTREQWVEYGADETLTEIYSDLEKLIGSKAFMLDRLPNFSKEDFISETIAELFSHIRNFNIDRKKTDKGFGLSGWINSQLMNKIGNVLKKKTATTETYTVDEQAETFQEIPEDTDAMELFEEEDLSLQAQLKKRQRAQLLAEKGIVEGASYSTFRQELAFNGVKGINETMKDIIEQTVLDILTSSEYSSLDIDAIQDRLQRTFEVKLKKVIQDAMGVEAQYIEFLSKNKDILLKNLDIASLVAIERKVDAKDKILTEFVRRLTTQKDVQDAIDNGWLSHIDNPAQGPNLYKVLDATTEQFIKFYTPPLKVESPKKVDRWNAMAPAAQQAIAENTGKTLEQARRDFVLVRSGLKGTRKDTLAERIAGQLAFDATMQVLQSPSFELRRQQLGLTPLPLVKIKEIARVIDRGIDVRFATKDGDYVQVTADIARAATVILKDAYANKEKNKGLKITDDISELLSKENLEFLGEFGSVAAEIADSFISYYYITRSQISEDDYLLEDVLRLTINYNAENFEEGKKVNAGTAMEQVIINMFSSAVKSVGLEMPNTPIEKGEAADVTFQLVKDYIEYGLENKMTRSQGPQITIRPIKDETGQYQLYVMGKGRKSVPLFSEKDFLKLPDQDIAAWSLVQQIINEQINTLNSIFKKAEEIGEFKGQKVGEFKSWETKLTEKQLEVFNNLLYRGAFSTVIEAENGFSSNEIARKYDQKLKKQGSIHIGMAGLSLMPSKDPTTIRDNELIQKRFEEQTDIKIPYLNENFPISVQFMLNRGRIAFKVNAIIDGRNITNSQVDLRNKDHIKAYAVAVKEALTARKAKKVGADLTAAVRNARKVNQNTESVGMSTFDFDETLIIKGENFVTATKGEQTKTISSEQWPIQGPQLANEGWKFDFSDFVNVRGGVDGPLMKEFKKKLAKFGPKNMYVLTARPQESAKAIHGWLKSKGINIPLANITGLGNSTGDAKAQWMLEKFAEGYNDMYFVDDALPNVEAVKHVLSQLDIKSDVQQAVPGVIKQKVKFSKSSFKNTINSPQYKKFTNSIKNRVLYHGGSETINTIRDNNAVWFYLDDVEAAQMWGDGEVYSVKASDIQDMVVLPDLNDVGMFTNHIQEKFNLKEKIYDIREILKHPKADKILTEWMDWSSKNDMTYDIGYNLYEKGNVTNGAAVTVLGVIPKNKIKQVSPKFSKSSLRGNKAVQNVLKQLDIKSDVQQAKIRFASSMSDYVNDMLERSRGIKADEKISRAISRKLGKNKNRLQVFIPPSAEDFLGLLYYIIDKGAKGEKDLEFFREALLDPFSRAYTELDSARMTILNDYDKLTKNYKDVYKKLGKTMPNSKYTFDNAIRVYLFNKHGHEIPGITQEEVANLVQRVNADMELLVFAETLDMLTKAEEYVSPTETWTVESIPSDLQKVVEGVHRRTFLEEWIQNKNEIFSEDNLNKMETTLGTYWREAMEDILYRMETGINRPRGRNRIDNIFSNWINNSIGAIMFFNTRSSLLQTISTANYINFEDNNIFAAGRAFANQKQYWADFTFLFNSDYLKSRRAGLKTDVSQSEIASAVATASNKALAALRFLLKIGFTPTQAADSFAISAGGATFYRNRVNKHLKEGKTQKEAEDQAFVDFREVTEESQQSARPDKISMQQTTNAGKLILAFMNAPMQYARIQKKAALDLIKRRGNDKANISRIIYYGAIQNFIFTAMQNAIFALFAGEEEEEEAAPTTLMTPKAYRKMKADKERADRKKAKFEQQKYDRIINGMIDTIVRGTGITGAALTTLKNVYLKFESEWAQLKGEKPGQFDIDAVLVEAAQISPAVGSKLRKGQRGLRTLGFDHLAIDEMSKLNTENPLWLATAPVVEGLTNIPVDRILNKINNLKAATDTQNEAWQRAAVVLGWSRWDVGIETGMEAKQAKKEAIKKRQEKKKQCIKIKADGSRCKNTVTGTGNLCYAHK